MSDPAWGGADVAVTGDRLAVIVGSALPSSELVGDRREVIVDPGGGLAVRRVPLLEGDDGVVWLARHGLDDHVVPHRIDHHAHLAALCSLGVGRVLALSSVGSLRLDTPVGSVVVPDDVYAPGHCPTFHDDARAHVVPRFDASWRAEVLSAWRDAGAGDVGDGGTYAQTPGPRFETVAEVRALTAVADLVGMTVASEVLLASEIGLPYAAVCVVDNLANGLGVTELTMDEFRANVQANRDRLRGLLSGAVDTLRRSAAS